MPELSIVIPTCNRADQLSSALDAIETGTGSDFEIIVVDGASNDATPEVLAAASRRLGRRLRVIHESRREGFVKGVNKGFRAALGEHLIWINDDARPLPGALDRAIETLASSPQDVGLVALFHRCDVTRNVAYETYYAGETYRLLHVRGTLYANFGLGRRETFERLDYFDERYFLNAADPDFSLKVWNAGMSVVPGFASLIDHEEHADARRSIDAPRGAADNEKLFTKWNLPPRTHFNDFNPSAPCTLASARLPIPSVDARPQTAV